LKLPDDSLTKEIRMTQDLMEIFIKYQIPSDLISYSENEERVDTRFQRVQTVKNQIKAMHEMLQGKKEEEIDNKLMEAKYAVLSNESVSIQNVSIQSYSNSIPSSRGGLGGGSGISKPQSGSSARPNKVQIKEQEEDDYTQLPIELDKKFEALDTDGALRPTIIDIGKTWTKKSQEGLLGAQTEKILNIPEQETERNKAFDLLDALSRSGCLAFDQADLHVVLASTHCFDKTLMNTVVQDNVNPIEKVERSSLILATTIHGKHATELLLPEVHERVATYSPLLFEGVSDISIKSQKEKLLLVDK